MCLRVCFSEFAAIPNLALSGDGRCDSPGHSATYCTYSLMDMNSNLVLSSNVIKVSESKNSYSMEKDGLVRCLNDMQVSNGVVFKHLVFVLIAVLLFNIAPGEVHTLSCSLLQIVNPNFTF